MLASQYIVNFPFWHLSSGEAWYGVIGLLAGLILGVHMSQPHWARRE